MIEKRIKFKFLHSKLLEVLDDEDLKMDFGKPVNAPLPYNNLPNGEYLIRGSLKEHRTEYWKLGNNWYLISTSKKDNGHFICDLWQYQIFPQKSEKEWNELNKVYKYLKPVWQNYVTAYHLYKQSIENSRSYKLIEIKEKWQYTE